MNIQEIRRKNLQALLDEAVAKKISQNAFAAQIGVSGAGVSYALNGKREIGEELARKAEAGTGKEYGWLDVNHSSQDIDERITDLLPHLSERKKQALLVFLTSESDQSPE